MSWSGPKGSLPLDEREKAARALRIKALMLLADGVSTKAVCERLNIARSTLTLWKAEAK